MTQDRRVADRAPGAPSLHSAEPCPGPGFPLPFGHCSRSVPQARDGPAELSDSDLILSRGWWLGLMENTPRTMVMGREGLALWLSVCLSSQPKAAELQVLVEEHDRPGCPARAEGAHIPTPRAKQLFLNQCEVGRLGAHCRVRENRHPLAPQSLRPPGPDVPPDVVFLCLPHTRPKAISPEFCFHTNPQM